MGKVTEMPTARVSKFLEKPSTSAAPQVQKEILMLISTLQAKEQNEVLSAIATILENNRKEFIERKRKELRYMKKNATIGRSFWQRILRH